MSQLRAEEILPRELIETIQQYVSGKSIYIPCREKKDWGSQTQSRQYYGMRNHEICEKYKLKNSKDYEYKEDIVLFGINVLRIYQYKMTTKYYLFGTIKVAQKTRRA